MSSIHYKIVLYLLIINCFPFATFAQNPNITYQASNQKIESILLDIAEQYDYDIVFNQSYFEDETASIVIENKKITTVLHQLLEGTNVRYKIKGQQIVLSKTRRIYGTILDKLTGEPLINAAIYTSQYSKGTYTNAYGYFSLEIPYECLRMTAAYVGYEDKQLDLQKGEKLPWIIELASNLELNEILVSKNTNNETLGLEREGEDLLTGDIKAIFATGGEADVFQYLYQKSGVQSGPDGLGGLHVRGGNSDQNLILLDGVKVYNPNHTLGLFSIFNSDILKHATFSKANFSPRNGGRLSSVLDMRLKEGSTRQWNGSISLSTLATQVNINGPLVKNKTGILLSLRRTHLDPVIQKITSDNKLLHFEEGYSNHFFYDVNAKIHHQIGKKDKLFLSYYQGGDNYHDESNLLWEQDNELWNDSLYYDLDWGNQLGALRWNHLFGDRLFSNLTFSLSDFDYYSKSYASQNTEYLSDNTFESFQTLTSFVSNITEVGADYDFDFFPSDQHHILFGIGYHWTTYRPGVVTLQDEFIDVGLLDDAVYEETLDEIIDNPYESKEFHFYVNENWKLTNQSGIKIGLRYSWFESKDILIDETASYHLVQPRLAFYYQLSKRLGCTISAERLYQPLHQISTSDIGFPNDLWVPSTAAVRPKTAEQFSMRLDYVLNKKTQLQAALYHKRMRHLIRYYEGASLPTLFERISGFWEYEVVFGNGTSTGLELEYHYQTERSKLDLSYTLMQSDRQFADLNEGASFPYEFDQRHHFAIHYYQKITNKISAYANWQFASGLRQTLFKTDVPFSPINTFYPPPDDQLSTINEYQLPDYHRLDAGLLFQFGKERFQHEIAFGVQNAYNRFNVFFAYELEDEFFPEDNGTYERASLPILPTLRYKTTF